MAEILDCTLRDGGYYTDWDFAEDITRTYVVEKNIKITETCKIKFITLTILIFPSLIKSIIKKKFRKFCRYTPPYS